MDQFDHEEALRLCKEVSGDLQLFFSVVNERKFYDIGYEVGVAARGGLGYDHILQDIEHIESCIHDHKVEEFDDRYCRIFDLVNFYDHLIDLIRSRPEHYRKGGEMLTNLVNWRNAAGRLVQMVCHISEPD